MDPFYTRLLREGTAELDRGNHAEAARDLRIAVFGMLEEPALLARGLVLLALAQHASGDSEGFEETFFRLAEVEDRFQAFSGAELTPERRAAFLELLTRGAVPAPALDAAPPVFRDLVDQKREAELAALPEKARRTALERLVAQDPKSVRWRLALARQAFRERAWEEVIAQATAALAVDVASQEARLLRGFAHAERKRWLDAAVDLNASGQASQSPRSAEHMLRALIELDRTAEAVRFLDTLSAELRADPRIRQLSARLGSRRD